ncbi:MAG: FimB/Mfa2 family fimbrial subunit [Tannerellaceae bacterium]|nr:FimB/Mfa2 family fimbrial subunit [Tannerellaceae bacterium]
MKVHWGSMLLGMLISSFLPGCVKEDPDECGNEGIRVHLYTKTPCLPDTTYPTLIKNIVYTVFDHNNILVTHKTVTNVELNRDYTEVFEVGSGLYTVIAWAGLNDENIISQPLQDGITHKDDLMFRVEREDRLCKPLDDDYIFYGESPAVYVPANTGQETVFETTAINMQEVTNRVTISIGGLTRNDIYEIMIESDNGSMNIDGTISEDEIIEYEARYVTGLNTVRASFTMLKLETGYHNMLVITDKTQGTELYRGNLLGTLLLKNPDVNLACDHDFNINFDFEDQCNCGTYILTEIRVNDWIVHSYEKDM